MVIEQDLIEQDCSDTANTSLIMTVAARYCPFKIHGSNSNAINLANRRMIRQIAIVFRRCERVKNGHTRWLKSN